MRLQRAAGFWSRLVALAAAVVLIGCGAKTRELYEVHGVVRAVDVAAGQAKIAHEDIPGFMPAMTMNFDVVPRDLLEGIEPGARVRFILERQATTLRITEITVLGVDSRAPMGGGLDTIAQRDRAPPFRLTDQDGRPFELDQVRGKAVLLDFIFTRCPGPCPILTSAHVTLQRRLPEKLASRTRFVSVTVDPEHDTPEKLRSYAEARGADLGTWSFLTGDAQTVSKVIEAYKIGWTKAEADQFPDHTVVTFLIDPEGRIARRYLGLEHAPEKLLRDLENVLS